MKAKLDYKSKKTAIIVIVAVILVIVAIIGTVAFVKGNDNSTAALVGENQTSEPGENSNEETPGVEENNDNQNNEEIPIIDENNGQQGIDNDNQSSTTNNNASGTANGTTNGTTTGTTNSNVPNEEYVQTTIIDVEDVLVLEDTRIGWTPLSLSAITVSAKLGINKPDLENVKLAYVQGDSLKELPANTAIQKGEIITYVIKVANKGNLDATSIRTIDTVPAGTELIEGSITANGTESNGKITWKTDIKAGENVEL